MELSPRLYHWLIRPHFFTQKYIRSKLLSYYNFSGKNVLDYGCGTGTLCTMFHPAGYLGIDIDSARIEYARNRYTGYRFQVCNKNGGKIAGSFDYILFISVLHHIPSEEIEDILKSIQGILKPRGEVLVLEPCFFPASHFNNYFMKIFDAGKHIRRQDEYFQIFSSRNYRIRILEKFKKLFYNEILFSASLQSF